MKNHEEVEKENGERWMLTYSDLITLLLALFIILFSMSNVDKEKYKAVIQSLGSVFGAPQGTAAPGNGAGGEINFPIFTPGTSEAPSAFPSGQPGASASPLASPGNGGEGNAIDIEQKAMETAKGQLEGLLEGDNLKGEVVVSIRPRGLVISINTRVLFASGSYALTPESQKLIQRIANILTPLAKNQICIEGHTDTDPISNGWIRSNWDLSALRSATVVQFLQENKNLKPENMSIVGYSEYRSLAPNDTPENKAKNRRVNIVILKDEYNKSIDIETKD